MIDHNNHFNIPKKNISNSIFTLYRDSSVIVLKINIPNVIPFSLQSNNYM